MRKLQFFVYYNKRIRKISYSMSTTEPAASAAGGCTRVINVDPLVHNTIYFDHSKVAVSLPFTDELKRYHPDGFYPLLEDPGVTKRAAVVGMFVIRPATKSLSDTISSLSDAECIYNPELDWIFNVNGVDGGGLISNCNAVDGYRLGMQYAMADGIIFGSNMAANDGVSTEKMPGYIWQSYGVCAWPHIKAIEPELNEKFQRNRRLWQDLGYLSQRKYPAQIIFTRSGAHFEGSNYFLQARMFTDKHPTGEQIEIYIVTSLLGAVRIREKAVEFGLADRIESMLVVLPPPPSSAGASTHTELSSDVDVTLIPQVMHDRYGMRIINHDGGQDLLHEFYKTGSLCQMNITLCRNQSVKSVLATWPHAEKGVVENAVANFDSRIRYFFNTGDDSPDDGCRRALPRHMSIAGLITDANQDLAIVTFNCSKKPYFS